MIGGSRKRRHHAKPGPRLDPTRPGAGDRLRRPGGRLATAVPTVPIQFEGVLTPTALVNDETNLRQKGQNTTLRASGQSRLKIDHGYRTGNRYVACAQILDHRHQRQSRDTPETASHMIGLQRFHLCHFECLNRLLRSVQWLFSVRNRRRSASRRRCLAYRLPEVARACLAALGRQLRALKILEFDRRFIAWHRSSATSKRLDAIPGVGPTLATALVASITDPKTFRSGRDFSAWVGLVPFRARVMWISVVLRCLELEIRRNLLSVFNIN